MAESKISDEVVRAAMEVIGNLSVRKVGHGDLLLDGERDRILRHALAAAYPLLRKQWESEQAEALREANADGYSDGFNDGYQAASEVHGA